MEPTAATAAAREKQKETEIGRRMGGEGRGGSERVMLGSKRREGRGGQAGRRR